jgi:hypothetical protein
MGHQTQLLKNTGCTKHALRIENAIVSNERFKTIVMYSAK